MVNRCVVFGCSNVPKKGVSLHEFPVSMKEREAWKRFVCRTRNEWNGPTNNSTICSCHFTAESFVNKMQVDMGLAKILFLKKDAIPSVYPEETYYSQAAGGLATPTPQPSSAMRKRKVLQKYMMNGSSNQDRMSNLAQGEPPQIKEEPEELCIKQEEEQLVYNQETNVKVEIDSKCEEMCKLYKNSKSECKELLDNQHHPRNIIRIPGEKGIDPLEKHICQEETDDKQLLWKQERSSNPEEEKPELPQIKEEWEKRVQMNGSSSNQEEVSTLDQTKPEPTRVTEQSDELCRNQEEESRSLNQDPNVNVELKSEYEEHFGDCKMFPFMELSHYHYGQRIKNAEMEVHKSDAQQQHLCEDKDEWKQKHHPILDQAEPKPSQINEEPEELCSDQDGEQLLLNQEADGKVEFKSDLLDHQPQLRSIIRIPVIKLERIDLSEKHIYEQLQRKEERSFSLDEGEPELPEIKEEWEEVYITEEDELELKQETDDAMVPKNDQERIDCEPKPSESQVLEENMQIRNSDAVVSVQQDSPSHSHLKHSPAVICQSYSCGTCGNIFTHSSHSEDTPEPNYCKVCKKKNSQSATSKALMKAFSCKVCKKIFTRRTNVKLHMRIHTGERPYSCNICEKRFTQNSSLNVHMRIHTGERPFTCKVCEKGFTKASDLKTHTRTHTGERPFSCDICKKGFIHSGGLTIHMRTHTGERPFACKLCEKGFMKSSGLKAHMMTHTGERPYTCEVCEKTFSESTKLKAHIQTHTAEKLYPCEICKKVFVSARNLACHMRTHTGERPYSCKLCQKCFTRSSSLCGHMRIHTGERPCQISQNVTLIVLPTS